MPYSATGLPKCGGIQSEESEPEVILFYFNGNSGNFE